MKIKADYSNAPQWKELVVKSSLPEQLKCLDEIAHNMWWVWNYEARDLFRDLDPEIYHEVKHNPVMLLEHLSFERKEEIVKDKALMKRIKIVYEQFRKYMDVKPDSKRPSVAYFCMEYGIHSALKISRKNEPRPYCHRTYIRLTSSLCSFAIEPMFDYTRT